MARSGYGYICCAHMPAASDRDRALHLQIVQKDDLAFARLCDELLESVFEKLCRFYPQLAATDESLVMDVVTDSFLNYFRDPLRFDPERQGLEKFLLMDAEGDLRNALEKIKRFQKKLHQPVELDAKNGNREIEDGTDPFRELVAKENRTEVEDRLNSLFDNPTDRAMAQLMLDGERRSSEYAKLLGLAQSDEEAVRREVKRNKDRIDKIIRRKWNRG